MSGTAVVAALVMTSRIGVLAPKVGAVALTWYEPAGRLPGANV